MKVELENIFKIKDDLVIENYTNPVVLYRAKNDLKYAYKFENIKKSHF